MNTYPDEHTGSGRHETEHFHTVALLQYEKLPAGPRIRSIDVMTSPDTKIAWR